MDELNHQLQEARLECQGAKDKCCHLEVTVKESGEWLQETLQRGIQMEADMKTKVPGL